MNDETTGERWFDLEERTARFGEAVIGFCKTLPKSLIMDPLVGQLVRSATIIGANYCEANEAVSKKEFRQKIAFAKKRHAKRSIGCEWSPRLTKADVRPLASFGSKRRSFS